ALGAKSLADRQNAVSVGNTALQRQIINVAAGTTDTDVVNIAQLKGLATAFGGGASVQADGTVLLPAYGVGGNVYHNVADALANLDGRVNGLTVRLDDLTNVVNNISGAGTGPIRYFDVNSVLSDAAATGVEAVAIGGNARSSAAHSVALGADSVADRDNVVSIGSGGRAPQIWDAAAGAPGNRAVNLGHVNTGL